MNPSDFAYPVKPPTPPLAVLWDYDGTLVDTQPIWLQVEQDIVASHGCVWTDEMAARVVGCSGTESAAMLASVIGKPDVNVADLDTLRSSMVAQRVAAKDLVFLPGVEALLDSCFELGIPCVLVSASPRFVLDAGMSRMPSHWFSATISGDEISKQKPDPQGYLLAASLLGVRPEDCLVIEDSVPGCTAGRSSGAAVLAIPNMTPLDPCPGQVVRESLADVSVDDLAHIYAEARTSLEY